MIQWLASSTKLQKRRRRLSPPLRRLTSSIITQQLRWGEVAHRKDVYDTNMDPHF